jgi:integrase/recombinase XerD
MAGGDGDFGLRPAHQRSAGIRRQALDFDNLHIKVKGRGNKERLVPMSFELRKSLYRHAREKPGLVFGTRTGTAVTVRNFQRDLKALCKKLNITGVRCSPHTLRHSFAVGYLRNGGNLFYLS